MPDVDTIDAVDSTAPRRLFLAVRTTTPFPINGELVEIALIDDAQVLVNTYVRPIWHRQWPEATAKHHVSPEDVMTAPEIGLIAPQVARLVANAIVYMYNAPVVDPHAGFRSLLGGALEVQCIMRDYAAHHGAPSSYYGGNKWESLTFAAWNAGFEWPTDPRRTALDEALATRAIWRYLSELGNDWAEDTETGMPAAEVAAQ